MLKSFFQITLSVILVFSVLSPPAFYLMEFETVTMELRDEKKENEERELEEKTHFIGGFLETMSSIEDQKKGLFSFYKKGISDFASKILLPPPEFTI